MPDPSEPSLPASEGSVPPAAPGAAGSPPTAPKRKLLPWEVDSPFPPPEQRPLPKPFEPLLKLYAWMTQTPKRRNFWVTFVRVVLIVGMVVAATAEIYPELTSASSPILDADPLTLINITVVHPDNCSAISGFVNGDDVIQGNFTVISPKGGALAFDILNSSTHGTWVSRLPNAVWGINGEATSSQIDFTAAYSDYYTFLWVNPNPVNETVYIELNYLSSLPPA